MLKNVSFLILVFTLENTILFKVLGGFFLIGGTVGAGYYAHLNGAFNYEYEMPPNEKIKNYLIVKSLKHITPKNFGKIYEHNFFMGTIKNFNCKFNEHLDETCEIYKLSKEEKKLATAIEKNLSVTDDNVKRENNYFKIVATKKFIDAIKKLEDPEEKIIFIQKNKYKNIKIFAKFQVIYKVENGEITERKNSLLFVKTIKNSQHPQTINNKNYKCQIEDEVDDFDCDIYDVIFSPPKKKIQTKNLPGETFTIENLKKINQHFVIKLKPKDLKKFNFYRTDEISRKVIKVVSNIDKNVILAELTPIFKQIDKTYFGKEKFWLAKIDTNGIPKEAFIDGKLTDYKNCTINNGSKIKCVIYKFDAIQNSWEKLNQINFSPSLTKITENMDVKPNNFFVIEFINDEIAINNLEEDSNIEFISDNSNEKPYLFKSKNRLFFDLLHANDSLKINGVYILN